MRKYLKYVRERQRDEIRVAMLQIKSYWLEKRKRGYFKQRKEKLYENSLGVKTT